MIKNISVEELYQNFNKYYVVDVREYDEIQRESIPHTIKYPLSNWHEPLFETVKPIVFLCRSGQRSLFAGQRYLTDNPTAIVYNLSGGILAWIEKKYTII